MGLHDFHRALMAWAATHYVVVFSIQAALPMLDAALTAAMEPKKKKEPAPVIVDATPLEAKDTTEPEARSH